ncbi:MAG: CdaR family protein [Myxococcota bacterium]
MVDSAWKFVRGLFVRNSHLKLIALFLTLAMYVWVSIDREVEATRYAPVRVDVPENMVLVSEPVDRARVAIRGKWSELNRFDNSQLDAINLDLNANEPEGVVPISREQVELPPGLRVISVEPSFMKYRLAKKTQKRVRIRPKITGDPADGHELSNVDVEPNTITLSGPATSLASLQSVTTESVDVTGRTSSFSKEVRLRVDDPLVGYDLDQPITLNLEIETQEIQRVISDIRVEPVNMNAPMSAEVTPQTVSVTLRGPKGVVQKIDPSSLLASVDLSDKQPGTFVEEVRIQNTPQSVEVVETQPTHFKVAVIRDDG